MPAHKRPTPEEYILMATTPRRPCLTCGTPTTHTCPRCGRQQSTTQKKGNRDTADERARRHILQQWRVVHGNICPGTAWCATPGEPHPTKDLTVDHIIPQSAGGTLDQGWEIMCRSANSRKHTQQPAQIRGSS